MNSQAGDRRWRAPAEHGQALVAPPWDEIPAILDRNQALQRNGLQELGQGARTELLHLALAYTRRYRDVAVDAAARRIILAGHQPELFHAGVWFKNLALDRVAKSCGGVAVNLIVDNDTCRQAGIRVPTGTLPSPRSEFVPLDRAGDAIAYEQRRVLDGNVFASFAERVTESLRPFIAQPLVQRLWPAAIERQRAGESLGACVAQARHRLEAEWDMTTLELPVSAMCRIGAFGRLTSFILAELPRIHREYNAALHEHRQARHVRSATHPVPNLATDDDWLEAPLWIWSAADPTRRRLFARADQRRVVLTDRKELRIELPLSSDGPHEAAAARIAALEQEGVRLRPRALLTTMFARLFLGDLFLHGIGGAKYDELTDELIRRWFGCEPPAFMVVSATCRLPIEHESVSSDQRRQIARQLREVVFQPERHVRWDALSENDRAKAADAVASKQRWLTDDQDEFGDFATGLVRHQQIATANAALHPFVAARRSELLAKREQMESAARAAAALGSREYSFCLFPEKSLRGLLLGMLPAGAYTPGQDIGSW